MSEAGSVQALEEALLSRAQALAGEYLTHGRETRELILEETNASLRRREEQETLLAKSLSERIYRQRVQAGELALCAELDRLRWTWVQSTLEKAQTHLSRLAEDENGYLPILAQLLKQAAGAIERDELLARVSSRDLERLCERWESWSGPLAPDKHIVLSSEPIDCMGGILLQSHDQRIRVDNTFEGRMERLQDELQRVILERLFADMTASAEAGSLAGKSGASFPVT
ncbi:MAG: V-type ATP synthase subunit E family protein [Methylococcaceae bacterium]|nr:V-type ATP synthase subunit E family protein [Methylococcaceae bacterium]